MVFFGQSATDVSNYLLTQGVFGFTSLILGIVVIYQQRKIDKKDAKIEDLQTLRLSDTKEVNEKVTTVLQGNAQAIEVLAAKIETGKRGV